MKKAMLLAPLSSVHERFNIANISALQELGYIVHLVANFSSDEHAEKYRRECENKGIVVTDIPFSRHSLIKNIKYVKLLKTLLKKGNYDIVHAHTETGGLLLRLALSSNRKTRYIYTAHGMSFYKGSSLKSQLIYRPIEKYICNRMDINIAINSEEFECLKKWDKSTARFVHGAGFEDYAIKSALFNSDKRTELGLLPGRKIILSVGELNNNKNHKVIIKALSEIEEDLRPYLLICGEGEQRDFLKSLAGKLGCENLLVMPGYRYDMPEIFKLADLFVFPSYHEGLSFALMQAMAAGLPVICSKIRGNVDLIDEGVNGYLFNPDDAQLLRLRIEEIINNDENAKTFAENNIIKSNLFSHENVKNELLDIYKDTENCQEIHL